MIEVTAAILHRDGKILICQRPDDKSCGGLWEFPGGKQEPGESLEDCLKQECGKNWAFRSAISGHFQTSVWKIEIFIFTFSVQTDWRSARTQGTSGLRPITPDEIDQYTFCPSDTKMLEEADRRALLRIL